MSDDLREWLKTIPVVTDADKAELREAITRLEAQQRGTHNAESMLCEILEVDDGSQILDAIQGLKERIKRLEEVAAKLANCARFLGTTHHDSMDVLRMKDKAMDELQNLEKEKP